MSTFNKICLWTSLEGIITENRLSETKSTSAVITMCLSMWSGRGHTSVSHLVWTSVVVGPSSYDKELASTAGHGRRADCLFHWRHLCPTVGEGVVTLHAAQAALPIIATNSIDLRADTRTQNRLGNWDLWEIVSRLYMRYRLFHIHFVHRNTFIFKLTSSWAWTIVSTSALREPVCQVQKKDDVLLLNKHHYLCPCSSFSCKHYPQSLQADMRAFSNFEQHNFQLRSAINNDVIPWAAWRLWIGVVHSYCNLHTT